MTATALLTQLGFFLRRRFLAPETCHTLREAMASAPREEAVIRPRGRAGVVLNRQARRTGVARVPAPLVATVEARLLATMPDLAAHFGVPLTGCQRLGFYVYEAGDFFEPHRDRDRDDPVAPDWVRARQVSVSIFLNDPAGGPEGAAYRGGALVFHGRRGPTGEGAFQLPLDGEEGLLVGFSPDWLHEVRPVEHGQRFSIVTWFV
jgi:SM-20-related protein